MGTKNDLLPHTGKKLVIKRNKTAAFPPCAGWAESLFCGITFLEAKAILGCDMCVFVLPYIYVCL